MARPDFKVPQGKLIIKFIYYIEWQQYNLKQVIHILLYMFQKHYLLYKPKKKNILFFNYNFSAVIMRKNMG